MDTAFGEVGKYTISSHHYDRLLHGKNIWSLREITRSRYHDRSHAIRHSMSFSSYFCMLCFEMRNMALATHVSNGLPYVVYAPTTEKYDAYFS